jgi:hypothetical protein
VVSIDTTELVPRPGLVLQPDGTRVEQDEGQASAHERELRDAWRTVRGGRAAAGEGPFPWRSTVSVRRYAAHVPQTALIGFDDGTVETVAWPAGERWHRWVFEKPVRVRSVQLDPLRASLLDLNKLDDGRIRERAPLASARWTLELKAWTELLFALVAAL